MANIQYYNSVLVPQQIEQLYNRGIDGIALTNQTLFAWWPLVGNNTLDYNSYGYNAIPNNVVLAGFSNYKGDYILGGAIYNVNSLNVSEVYNCGNVIVCNNGNFPHVYLDNITLSSLPPNIPRNQSTTLGLANTMLP